MKLRVGEWTAVQYRLPKDGEGDELWEKIEQRTWGKLGQTLVTIRLTKAEQEIVDRVRVPGEQRRG